MYRKRSIERSGIRQPLIVGDKPIWVLFFILTVISLIAVYSSIGRSAIEVSGSTPLRAFIKHLAFVIFAYAVVVFASHVNYRKYSRVSQLLMGLSIALLAYLFLTRGARWIVIPHVGQFQPSEIAKVALILYIARLITFRNDDLQSLETFIRLLVPIVFVSALVVKENFSTAALIFISSYVMLFFCGVNKRYWWRVLLFLVLAVGLALFIFTTSDNAVHVGRSDTWGARVERWIHPDNDAITQENMARMAIARGGLFGVGIGNTVFARIMTQADNDFIYAIIIEETGTIGGILLLLIYIIFYFRCIKVARECQGRFGSLVVIGIGTVIFLQALVNMSVSVGVIPVTGQTLPFVSSGGTAFVFLAFGVGVIQAVANDSRQQKETAAAPDAAPVSNI